MPKSTTKVKPRSVAPAPARPRPVPPVPAPPVSEADRRAARMERKAEARATAVQRARQARIRNIGIGAAAVLVVLGLIGYAWYQEASKPGEHVAMQASPHIPTVQTSHAAYTTDPPTSGPHVPVVPAWGVMATPIPKELQVHGLEDGGVVINYQPDIDKATVDKLTALTQSYDGQVILSPYPGLSDPIVLTAWTRIERLKAYDEAAIRRFVDAYRGIDHHGESGS